MLGDLRNNTYLTPKIRMLTGSPTEGGKCFVENNRHAIGVKLLLTFKDFVERSVKRKGVPCLGGETVVSRDKDEWRAKDKVALDSISEL